MKAAGTPPGQRLKRTTPGRVASESTTRSPGSGKALLLPSALAALLIGFGLISARQQALFWTFLGSGIGLLVWAAVLYASTRRNHRVLVLEVVIRKQHWIQACAQGTILLYWGYHTRLVYPFLPFVVAQLVFAYAFDSLLSLSRRSTYTLGFGPFPIIFSINLFLWFQLDWFYWQFAMIAVGFLAKELIRWTREGRRVHIFNPSSFPLGVFSLALILTGTWGITYATPIANTQADVPYLYAVIFLVALPGQLFFGVARMTLAAVAATYLFSLAYFQITGTYFFYDSHIPVQVFLGMHLLFTDPSTSPRSESGRILFGILYALGVVVFYVLLEMIGAPTLFDKLLPVPILNLLVRRIDVLTASKPLAALDAGRVGAGLSPMQRNVAYTAIWTAFFIMLSITQGVGDRHPGQYLPFWTNACQDGSGRACRYATVLTQIYCVNGSGWACNEAGIAESARNRGAESSFKRACDQGFTPGCENLSRVASPTGTWARGDPVLADLPIILRGTKPRLAERDPATLYRIGCAQGWPHMCGGPPVGAAGRPR
jgi:hypothetical protein